MKFAFTGHFLLLILIFAISFVHSAPPKKYNFVPAKCVPYTTDKNIGGPLKICTFPPQHNPPSQEYIDAVIEHIQGLELS